MQVKLARANRPLPSVPPVADRAVR